MIPIIFFGTHQFAAIILESVIKSGLFDIKMIVTMPDRPAGRSQELQKTAVKMVAEKYYLAIDQPSTLKNYVLPNEDYLLNLIVDYGLIIPENIIEKPVLGSINIHPSALPKYRGASPIQSALMAGEKETAISIMLIDDRMDHGPILLQEKIDIDKDETFPELYTRLALRAGLLILHILPQYICGKIKPIPQEHEQATFTKILCREDGKIDFSGKNADEIYNLYRGLTPWPGIYTIWNRKRLKLLEISPTKKNITPAKALVENKRLFIGTQKDSVEIKKLQLEGKKPMNTKDFLIGYGRIDGSELKMNY